MVVFADTREGSGGMKEEYVRWSAPHRELEMIIFGHAGYPVLLFPTPLGRCHENRDRGLIAAAAGLVEQGRVRIYCPDGIDAESWYNPSIHPADRVRRHMDYERAIVQEVLERARRETREERVAVAGCGFGGYHAVNLAFHHPDKVGFLFSLSGAFDIRQFLHGYYDDDCYFNNPVDYVPGLDGWRLDRIRRMGIALGTGEWDICRAANHYFSELLQRKGVEHSLDVRPGAVHDWPAWREMFPHYLSQIGRS